MLICYRRRFRDCNISLFEINIYFFNLYKAFIKRINQMRDDIKDIKIKLFDYEGNGIDILEEKKN